VINNSGGGIFRFISGPDESPFLEEFFEARHNWKAEKIAEAFGVKYFSASSMDGLRKVLPLFYENENQTCLLEIFTPPVENAQVLKCYFEALKS
jgi:2-succinyl-5-enolpyruvyl-6-hydroxy-3-cyclohexene-1-carboxylate synthase